MMQSTILQRFIVKKLHVRRRKYHYKEQVPCFLINVYSCNNERIRSLTKPSSVLHNCRKTRTVYHLVLTRISEVFVTTNVPQNSHSYQEGCSLKAAIKASDRIIRGRDGERGSRSGEDDCHCVVVG